MRGAWQFNLRAIRRAVWYEFNQKIALSKAYNSYIHWRSPSAGIVCRGRLETSGGQTEPDYLHNGLRPTFCALLGTEFARLSGHAIGELLANAPIRA